MLCTFVSHLKSSSRAAPGLQGEEPLPLLPRVLGPGGAAEE